MARPRKSTRDEILDQFSDFDLNSQEAMLDDFELIHRQAKRRQSRKAEIENGITPEEPAS